MFFSPKLSPTNNETTQLFVAFSAIQCQKKHPWADE